MESPRASRLFPRSWNSGAAAPLLEEALEDLSDLFFPPICYFCKEPLPYGGEELFCRRCRRDIRLTAAPYCLRCSRVDVELDEATLLCPECLEKSHTRNPLSRVIAGAQYSGKVPDLVSNFKYSGLRYLSKPLARFITEHPEFPVLAPHIYALVPVPLHFLKEFARGFNQAEDLAYSLSAASGIPVVRALKRTRLNRPQASLSMESRKANLSGAFAFRESQRARFASIGKNQLVALVDDVCTTGTTAELCARALKKAGLRNIILLCAAKT